MKLHPPILAVLIAAAALMRGPAMALEPLEPEEIALLTTRTSAPEVSPQLKQALDLDIPEWHKKGAPKLKIKIDDDAKRRSNEASLQALNALDPAAIQSDYDRAWVTYQKASVLKALGRKEEAAATFRKVLDMPRTAMQARQARMELNRLGDEQQPGDCGPGLDSTSGERPDYPMLARSRGIEGWVRLLLDIRPDGSVGNAMVYSSSMRVFEQPSVDFFLKQRYRTETGSGPGRTCFAWVPVSFEMENAWQRAFSSDEITDDYQFTYQSIGAARRVRGLALEAANKVAPEVGK